MGSAKNLAWVSLPFQFFFGGAILAGIVTGMHELWSQLPYDGLMSLIGIGLNGVVYALPAMILAALIGMPLRISPRQREYWFRFAWIVTPLMVCAGILGIYLSYQFGTAVQTQISNSYTPEYTVTSPSQPLHLFSVLITAFGFSHFLLRPKKPVTEGALDHPSK
ncbi:hypothetical protein QBL02_12675 [Leucobacter sp. UT-8R-CII-1-4]|uniref:hypothetical protein n=1 Tax=Leucobacter sp. UT-8R-CII-1-4 TaxID=3040075 RepID=UPI0024A9A109|nr:hypothetical protein [Leucobacter sp. UT-8R-CII-1-4]MDI6024396.1 hypothetical protein [Leucobacter sp. UT-8R-CII-1-4]